jgi:hypothetical protein
MNLENQEQNVPRPIVDREFFVEYLKKVSAEVRSWPIWKQSMLGSPPYCQPTEGLDDALNSMTRDSLPPVHGGCELSTESADRKTA